ncbi:MAG: RnfABCDGE type electron transport complex subunit D [bacterium]
MKSGYLNMELRTSPHLARGMGVETIMRNVVYALLPLVAMAVYLFGLSALLLIAMTTLSALLTEHAVCRISGGADTLRDFSAAITGLLLGLTLPPGLPLWMGAVGGIISIALGKSLFGGLGWNVFNPALVGRAFLQAAFPVAITTWNAPLAANRFTEPLASTLAWPLMKASVEAPTSVTATADAVSTATPLAAMKFEQQGTGEMELLLGTVSGSAGETAAVLILLCGAYLALRGMLDWRIPVGILGTVAALSGLLHWLQPANPPPLFMLASGGLMLGAVFMATDMVTSPVTPLGIWLFAVAIGALTVVIRLWGGLPEGVMYAILMGNALVPLLNLYTQPRVYGTGGRS